LKLNPKDIGTWQKLYEVLEQGGEERALLAFGNEMTKHLRRLGLEELARNHLSRMLVRFPALASLRFAHAESLFALGCKEEAVEELLNLARDLLKKGRLDEGERALAKIIEYDHEHKRAREIYEKVRSGKLARQRARRRQLLRSSIAAVLLAAIFVFLGYDFFARREFALATRQVFAEGLIERGQYQAAAERLTKALDRHALSLVRFLEGRELLEAIREAQARRESAIGPPAISPQEKAEASSQGLKTKPSASAKSSPPSGQAARSSQPGGVGMKKTAKSGK
jgi:tetratricopeptide (TPR) repeat protein